MTRRSLSELMGHPHLLRQYTLIADGERGALTGPRLTSRSRGPGPNLYAIRDSNPEPAD
jgi:hypothetical protein